MAEQPSYREADVIAADGRVTVAQPARADHRVADSPLLGRALAEAVAEARRAPLAVSPPLRREVDAGARERLRLFVVPAGAGALALLVDTDRLLEGIDPAAAADGGPPMRWLLLDGHGRWIVRRAEGEAAPLWHAADEKADPDLAALLAQMDGGGRGAAPLGREAAVALGLDRRRAVAGFAPVRLPGERPWSIAVVASAMRVRDRALVGAWRLAAATGLAGLLVGVFGFFAARQQRRAQQLTDALRLAEATAALRERSEKIVETIPVGVMSLAADGRVSARNPYLAGRGVGTGALREALSAASDDDLALLAALVAEARGDGRPRERRGLRMKLADGEPRDLDAWAVPLARPLADADCFLVLHDRTAERALERNLARADKLATIGTLAAGIAHEVGTPLGIISGRAEQLLGRVTDETMRKGLSSIMAQVDKVSTTVRQLLDFARVRPVEAVRVTPAQVLQSATALLEHRFRQARVALAVDAAPSVPAISADPGQLEQVFVNLMMNAVDACAAGGHVRASAAARDGEVCFEVADDGAGIAPEHLSSVLDPFFTTKKRGQGTGLGLTIAADIVKNHGGHLEIASEPGRGTTVRVRLPVAREGT